MKKLMTWGLAGVCLAILTVALPARALMMAPAPIPQRVATAELVVVGKLGKVEGKNTPATPAPGAKDKVEYQVLALEVGEALIGKAGKEIRVGFIPPQNPTPGTPIRPRFPRGGAVFSTGQEGVFFLTKHHEQDFYVASGFFDFLDKKTTPTYETDLDLVKRCARLLADPEKSLKAKDAEDRLFTVAMLLTRYRTPKGAQPKQEPIDAEMSKLILQTLAEADWNVKPKPGQPFYAQVNPQQLFYQLGAQPKDGWTQPKDFKQFPDAAKAWLKDNADKFRIQRYVWDKQEKKD